MNRTSYDKIILFLSMPLAFLIILNSYCGLFIPGIYARETHSWYLQAIGQDIFDLFLIVPILLITSISAYRHNKTALLLWAGVNVFIIYTYVIYCFAVHFNSLFLVYCFILGLSFYSLTYFLFLSAREFKGTSYSDSMPVKTIGIFLIVITFLFYLTWLKDIVPAILSNYVPKNIIEGGIITNPVHVLDLSVFLPALLITAVMFLKKKPFGLILTPVMLLFCVLMALSISTLIIVMKLKGMEGDWSVPIIFDFIALVSIVFLVKYLKILRGIVK
jgi:hypothetical protein